MKIHFLYFPTFHISHLYTFCFHIFTQFHPPQQPFNFSFQPKLNFSSYFSVSTIASNDILLYTTSTVCVSEFCAQLRLCFSHVYTFFFAQNFLVCLLFLFSTCTQVFTLEKSRDSLLAPYFHILFFFAFQPFTQYFSPFFFCSFHFFHSFSPLCQFFTVSYTNSKGIRGSAETSRLS